MSQLKTTVQKSAKNAEEAINAALAELGITAEEAEIEIIEEGSKGFLGIGAKDAVVSVSVKGSAPVKSGASSKSEKTKKKPQAGTDVERAVKFLSDIFGAMQIDIDIDAEEKDDVLSIDLSGEKMGIVIGKRGDTLDSLQYLTSIVVNRKVSLDTENFRQRRTETLKALAERLADKVARTHKRYTLEPMNAYERRIIHASLQGNDKVTTYSIGDEPFRKVVIAPKDRPRREGTKHTDKYDRRPSGTEAERPAEEKRIPAVPKRVEIPRQVKFNNHKASNFEEYLAEQEAAAAASGKTVSESEE